MKNPYPEKQPPTGTRDPNLKTGVIVLAVCLWGSLGVVHEIDYAVKLLSEADMRVLLNWLVDHWQIAAIVSGAVMMATSRIWRGML